MNRPDVLVVEDDASLRKVLLVGLRSHGYRVHEAASGQEALNQVEETPPDLVILDLGLPDMDGVDVLTAVRSRYDLPIIVLSARSDEQQQIRALDAGANDYVTKPFREGELMARLRVAFRQAARSEPRRDLVVGDLQIDTAQRRVFLKGVEVNLTPIEYRLIELLAHHAGQVVPHPQLLREVWGPGQVSEVQYLRVYIKQLRQKLEENPGAPTRILTALGVGYRLVRG